MRNAQIEIADIAGQVDTLRHSLEMELERLRAQQADLSQELRAVKEQVAHLQSAPAPAARPAQGVAPPVEETLPEEILLVLSAAVAAYLGHSARIRAAYVVHEGASPWAQQGRVFVQASHNLLHHA